MWWFTKEDDGPSKGKREVVFEGGVPYEILGVQGFGALTIRCSVHPMDPSGKFQPEAALLVDRRKP